MSFRPAPATKRTRPAWERDDRRNLYINLGFIGAIVIALLFLVGAAAASYYDSHYSTVATVNGTTLNKDALRNRFKVDSWRIQRISTNVQNALSSGRLTQDQADQQRQQLQSQASQLPGSSLTALIDATLQEQLGAEMGVTVSDQEIDDAITKEATSPELRHVWVIAVTPESSGGTPATDAAKAAARKKIDGALADVKSGTPWEEVAKAVSQDGSATRGGDLGWVTADAGTDEFLKALFALEATGYTGVVEEPDGTLRIGRVSEIEASRVDANYQQAITDAEVPLEAYRAAVKAQLLKTKLQDKVAADVIDTATVQRRVAEIFIQGSPTAPAADQAKSAHILFSPNGDPNAASSVSSGDPAWAEAEKSANTAYAELKKDPSKFEELAKTLSNDTGSGAQGGELGWYAADQLDPGYSGALFGPRLTEGQILPPVRSSFGWHIIRFEGKRKGGADRIKDLREQIVGGADFGALALENSDASDKNAAGDMGWVARNQLPKAEEDAIFAAPIGKVSDVLETDNGWYLYLVKEEATRKPEGAQVDTLKQSAFENWYAAKKAAAKIVEEPLPADLTQ